MSSGNITAIPFVDLVASNAEWRDGHDKALTIIGGTMAIVSTLSSSLLIFIIARSRDRLGTTYHRLVLGMSVADIVYSACFMTFAAMRPTDMSYEVWNARGNQATCSAMGTLIAAGAAASAFYSCALNMNYLAVVRYNCSEAYIRNRIEKFMHAFAIGIALAFSIVPLAGKNYNGGGPNCQLEPVYKPPHCTGIEDGQVREDFEIPCGRGRDGFPTFYFVSFFITMFIPPIVIGVSLGMMYQAVRNQERRTVKYGAGSLNLNAPGAADGTAAGGEDGGGGGRGGIGRTIASSVTSLRTSLARRFRRRAAANSERPLCRIVMQRATAYSFAFFLTWSWTIMIFISTLAMRGIPDSRPNWFIALFYLAAIFQPLQGFFNLLIYMEPRVTSARRFRGRDLSWRQAIVRAFCTSLGLEWRGGNIPPAADSGGAKNDVRKRRRAPTVTVEETAVIMGPSDWDTTVSPAEEEKVEIQDPGDD